ncbi:cora-domain-containing protein [Yamadazyma tenuis ATCC 10573]|uniref:Cora-domain-containing protein n=1 Tax=Candida tenuis (strain ATCC 10573 / BCRC 21748 / CBS 615 / JCM 9827 / NBRC 10315 / NRRL Y-1498 / VKM Y-70) TaxID=590646 RepID=G3B3D8_CANTC|nr:cora-domain-containing protein [Yamadazyma tenuis ATCC 10573]EGV64143.1 cora-domain-containing protein [Yamadazyma tenuis ATCC 10573]
MGSHKQRNPYGDEYDKNDDASTTSSTNKDTDYSGAFIDHRLHNDLAHLHSSPSRARRRNSSIIGQKAPFSSYTEAATPLTDRNLRTWTHGNQPVAVAGTSPKTFRSIAIDMDKYTRDQSNYLQTPAQPMYHAYHDDPNTYDNGSINSMEFGESNPPSEHSGDSTSLDDVCFPDYYDDINETAAATWPDLKVLKDFISEEKSSLEDHHREPDQEVSPTDTHSEHVNFRLKSSPGRVEDDELGESRRPFQVTPTPIRPDEVAQLPGTRRPGVCRFTYFRDDLPNTIHAPTLSELLVNEKSMKVTEQPNLSQKWRDEDSREEVTNARIAAANGHGNGETVSQTPGTGTVSESVSGDSVTPFWLDVLDPTEEEMKVLSKTFGIHPLTTEDIFLGEAREKVELFKSYYFVSFMSFDIVYERRKQRSKEKEKKLSKLQELHERDNNGIMKRILRQIHGSSGNIGLATRSSSSNKSTGKKIREGELSPLSMYIIVFRHAVITFHFSPTPHPINVRRRARLLKDFLTVSSDWISYALIDDITDSFAPMIESIEDEVNAIEEAILRMHAGDSDSDSDSDSDDDEESRPPNVFVKRTRTKSTVDKSGMGLERSRTKSRTTTSGSRTKSSGSRVVAWKRKGDMLRRIGECRKRVMSLLRLLGSKADVIKGFTKRLNEVDSSRRPGAQESKSEISMYSGDIQDHIITMVQSLNHYEKLLARFHSNYLAQINIDMTKVNNDTNNVLGKITILGTIVLPINVVTGLWGMNCLVPGQGYDGLTWFWSIIGGMFMFSVFAYNYAKRAFEL